MARENNPQKNIISETTARRFVLLEGGKIQPERDRNELSPPAPVSETSSPSSPASVTIPSASSSAQNKPFLQGIRWGSVASGLAASDAAVMALSVFLASAAYHLAVIGTFLFAGMYGVTAIVMGAVFAALNIFNNRYELAEFMQRRRFFEVDFWQINTLFALALSVLFLTQWTEDYSRGAIICQYAVAVGSLWFTRSLQIRYVRKAVRRQQVRPRRILSVGPSDSVMRFRSRFSATGGSIRIVSSFLLPHAVMNNTLDSKPIASPLLEETLQNLQLQCRRHEPDDIVLLVPWSQGALIQTLVQSLAVIPAAVHVAPPSSLTWFDEPIIERLGSATTIRLSRAPLTLRDRMIKRTFDILGATIAGLLLSPLFILIPLAILIESRGKGSVLFYQRRRGFNQNMFQIVKFRTMTVCEDGDTIVQATRKDRRITRVGAFLRWTSLDEIPQIWNVFKGDMSLVGPRPHAVAHDRYYEDVINDYARRHNVKPGITGWAQVNGFRGETDTSEKMQGRIEHDIFYIDHWSPTLDIRILFKTILSLKTFKNAF